MNRLVQLAAGLAGAALLGLAPVAACAQTAPAPAPVEKNWTAPTYKTAGQALVERFMAANPDLLSITLHAIPPGKSAYTMFAGSWPDRVGKVSADDDIMSATQGFVILDPRYGKKDPVQKFLVIIPLRDAKATNIGAIVFGFKDSGLNERSAPYYLARATALREAMQASIPDHAAMFAEAK